LQKYRKKDLVALSRTVEFATKTLLLALLDDYVREDSQHDEYIHWEKIKFSNISPNYHFQQQLAKQLQKEQIFCATTACDEPTTFYLNVRLDGYSEPSLFSITQQLRHWFYFNLTLGIPFKSSEEVKAVLYELLYQEIIQFIQSICKMWQVQFTSHASFQQLCYRLLESIALEQIFYLAHTALLYLYEQKALETRNDGFINTHRLKKPSLNIVNVRLLKNGKRQVFHDLSIYR
jgi:hypothetical protein